MKAPFLMAVLAVSLTACGGGSSSSSSNSETDQFAQALSLCGNGQPLPVAEGAFVYDDDQRYVLEPTDSGATVEIQDSGSRVCITDDLAGVGTTGTDNAAYVNGDADQVIITGDGNLFVIWGDVAAMDIEGNNNRVYLQSVATYDDQGTGNSVQNISNFSFSN